MIGTLADLKGALGISPDDVTKDADLTSAMTQADALIFGYVGYDLTDTVTVREYIYTNEYTGRNFIHLPEYPVVDIVEVLDGDNLIDPANYTLIPRVGRVDFRNGITGYYTTIRYHAGWNPVPADLKMVELNLASSIYNNGGQVTAGGTNQLKSLTMFDAMSMSFDTGAASATGPESLLSAWAFILDKYSINKGPVVK